MPAVECEISWWKPLRKSKRPPHHLASYALGADRWDLSALRRRKFVSCWMPMIALPAAGVFNRPDKIILLAGDSKSNNAPAYKFDLVKMQPGCDCASRGARCQYARGGLHLYSCLFGGDSG